MAQPVVDRNAKAHLRPLEDRLGEQPRQGPLEDVLLDPAPHFQIEWDRGREFHEQVIQERRAGLQGVRHAGDVHLHQEVIGQIQRRVHAQRGIPEVRGVALSIGGKDDFQGLRLPETASSSGVHSPARSS